MSLVGALVVVALGLALALLTVRTWIQRRGRERDEYSVLLGVAAVFGFLAGHALHLLFADADESWESWPLGPLGGIALVELGPPALKATKAALRGMVGVVRKYFGSG